MGEIDEAYIVSQEHRPKPSIIYAEGIPLIDLSPLTSPDQSQTTIDSLVSEIRDSCKKWGFFQVINHGVDMEKCRRLEELAKKFFELPLEEKKKVRRDERQILGYYECENTKNVRDWKEVFDFVSNPPIVFPVSPDPDDDELVELHNVWPQYPPELKEVCEEYGGQMEKLAFKLLELIALSLGLQANRFHSFFKEQITFARINRYPPCPAPNLALGVGRHKDPNALTILYQDDVGGLQVKRKSDGEWITVKPTPDAYIINVGDLIQVWTNDAYESAEHRVMVNSEKERYSIPCFFGPAHYTMVEPLEELVNEQNPPKYRAYNWGKFLSNRRFGDYKKLNVENIQISHFRIPELANKLEEALAIN